MRQKLALISRIMPSVLMAIAIVALSMAVVSNKDFNKEQAAVLRQQQEQISTLQQQLDNADNVISDLQKKSDGLEADKEALKGDLDSLTKENATLQKEITDLKKKISIAEQQIKAGGVTSNTLTGKTLAVEASAYIAMCSEGCSGITRTGIDVRHRTPKIIAVDPKLIPLGTVVEIFVDGKSIGQYTAADTGGAIKGHKIDILMKTKKQANNFGRQQVDLTIVGQKSLDAV